MYGRETRLPLEAEKSSASDDPTQLADVQKVIDRMTWLREENFPKAKKNTDDNQRKQKEQYFRRSSIAEGKGLKRAT